MGNRLRGTLSITVCGVGGSCEGWIGGYWWVMQELAEMLLPAVDTISFEIQDIAIVIFDEVGLLLWAGFSFP